MPHVVIKLPHFVIHQFVIKTALLCKKLIQHVQHSFWIGLLQGLLCSVKRLRQFLQQLNEIGIDPANLFYRKRTVTKRRTLASYFSSKRLKMIRAVNFCSTKVSFTVLKPKQDIYDMFWSLCVSACVFVFVRVGLIAQ